LKGQPDAYVYVSNTQSNDVTVIDGKNDSTTTVSLSGSPVDSAVAVNPATNLIYVANGSNVTVIDGRNNSTVALSIGGPAFFFRGK